MAVTGRRPVMHDETDEQGKRIIEWEDMSEAAHVDMVKFIVQKVLPNAKEYDSKEDRAALDKWADVIAADAEPVGV